MSDIIKLPYYVPKQESIVAVSAGVRPYREGGIRMEKEISGGKTFYHDYGHGGGGISLAYGCAQHVVETMFLSQRLPKDKAVAVLGSGIIGLTTALLLIQNGYKVRLYAQLIPFERSASQPQITTTVAAGYWMPLKIGNKEETQKFATDTWNHYAQIQALQKKQSRQLGIEKLRTYCVNDDEQLSYMPIEGVIDPKPCKITFGDGKINDALTFETYIIESVKYLPYISELLQASGRFTLVRKRLDSLQEVLALGEDHIFNCLGFGAKKIFGDNKLKGIKGHVLKFELPATVKDFVLFMKVAGRWILQVPQRQSNKLAIGISYEQGKSDPFPEKAELDAVLHTAQNYFESVAQFTIRAKL